MTAMFPRSDATRLLLSLASIAVKRVRSRTALAARTALLAPVLAGGLAVALAAAATAQGGGFVAGDMYYYSPFLDDSNVHAGGVLRIDPLTGAASHHFLFDGSIAFHGMMAFDPYRQRLLVGGTANGSLSTALRLFLVDGAGASTDAGLAAMGWRSFAPVGDGRVYFHADSTNVTPFRWLDAANRVHTLLNAAGTAPYTINGNGSIDVHGMLYEPGTHSLLLAYVYNCAGVQTLNLAMRKLALSADGTRVAGEGCDDFFVHSSGATGRGWSRNAAGQVFLVGDTNQSAQAPRMTLVDPVAPDISAWASNGSYVGTNTITACAWSSRVGKLIITHWAEDKLRGYGFGEVGVGSHVVTVSQDLGVSTEPGTLIDIPFSADSGAWIAYGTGLAGAGGRVPGLWGQGNPEPGNAFTLRIDEVVGGAGGVLFTGLASAAAPFKGGTFRVGALLVSTPVIADGAGGVPGAGTLALPAVLPGDPALSGLSIYLQAAFHDTAAVQDVSLTQGLELEIG
jgi:hypothetical protein